MTASSTRQPEVELTVAVAVIDSRAPKLPEMMRATATVIGVTAGVATADQLARAAVAASADGREIAGILVADPDPADRTTGRIPHLDAADATQAAQPLEGHSNDGDQTVNDPDQSFAWPSGMGSDLPERLWVDDGPGWGG